MSTGIAFGGTLFFWVSKRKVRGWDETNAYPIYQTPSGTLYIILGTSETLAPGLYHHLLARRQQD